MKIGNIETKNNVFLAPMAGGTDLVFRVICKESLAVGLFILKWLVQREYSIITKTQKSF